MKLENCGRCGLEPKKLKGIPILDKDGRVYGYTESYGCPVHDANEDRGQSQCLWNAAQFAARTERINAAAVAAVNGLCSDSSIGDIDPDDVMRDAEKFIDAQDAAARARWAEMQKGE